MAPDPKPAPRTRSATSRRAVVRVQGRTMRHRLRDLIEHPGLGWGVLIAIVFALGISFIANWAREQPLVAVGQVMDETRMVRVRFRTADEAETQRARDAARSLTPRVFTRNEAALEEIRSSLANLPASVAAAESLDNVDPRIRERFGLNAERLAALRATAADPAGADAWARQVATLLDILGRRPLLDAATFQASRQEGISRQIELRGGPRAQLEPKDATVNINDPAMLADAVPRLVDIAGFAPPLRDVVVHRLTHEARPTFVRDQPATLAAQEAAAAAIPVVRREYAVGQIIFSRGDVLDEAQRDLHARELAEFRAHASAWRVWTRRFAVAATVASMTALLGGYLAAFAPRIVRRSGRVAWIAALMGTAIALACSVTVLDPRFVSFAVPGAVVLVAVLMRVAYERGTAAAVAGVTAVLLCLALERPIGTLALCLLGIASAVWTLAEVRDRREIIRMSAVTALVLLGGAVIVGLVDRPFTELSANAARVQTLSEGVLAGLAGLVVGGITMFALPFVERAFDITTGMTLIELRDPKQPLLREMQQRAPGTYNHSLNVASIAEAAAEAIGADSLLTYVGCLYHDIGKINKPEYFVENQRGGANRHDKLSPAMSLLVIVGHVKDGVEMAREHGIPRPLVHFIEAHHGTTLVEFFYRRAQEQARGAEGAETRRDDADRLPSEVDYRYPGPRPQTREVAITMLADAVESATRTLAEPTPARIEALVRQIAQSRLADGQFDECDLTLKQVRTISDSISKSVASIYHGRIKYASTAGEPKKESISAAAAAGEKRA